MNGVPTVRKLEESSALIVGGTAGIGLYSALALAEAGVPNVVLVGRSIDRGRHALEVFAEAGVGKPAFVQGDARTPEGAAEIVASALEVLPAIDILVCSTAADVKPELFKDIPTDDIGRIFTELALPSMHMTSSVLPQMRSQGGGVIVNVASDAAKTATPGESVIGAAKAGIVMFTRTIAIEEKRHGIRANAMTPSLVHGTASTERITADGFSAKLFAKAAQQAHLGVPIAEDLGALAVFLCSPAAAKLTGQAISVNGGISAA
ncbi:NAD(P)-dependent dehydrogenase (short-subunit alcohol dehydrogenase family) [Williamsia limnetica]|uniref:3-oxoacyl-[acyl-carrier-protein] reductase MabA n=1 Tax=Williamsia limnetica TaxID=882452 RepID=A0A318RAV3_WILLI|nr:SDR family oxidoreductase [Williamsia limnetica]PYE11688.1 NAD(P)-dependent dehydrogenase (short-subunit alcohol dehydrogenase family) [Williamsia limnetica]